MNLLKDLKTSTQAVILLLALVSALAYLFSHDDIFRPPASRSRQSSKLMQSESTEPSAQEGPVSVGPKPGRIQVQEMKYLLKAL